MAAHDIYRASPFNDTSQWTIDSKASSFSDGLDTISITDRPGWLRLGANYNANTWLGRGNALFALHSGGIEDVYVETAIDWKSAWRTEYPTATYDYPPLMLSGLAIFDNDRNQHIAMFGVRTDYDNDVIIGFEAQAARPAFTVIPKSTGIVYLRLEHRGRDERVVALFRTNPTAAWTEVYSVSH